MRVDAALSARDRLGVAVVVEQLEYADTEQAFKECMDHAMREVFPHDMLLGVCGKLTPAGLGEPHLLNHRFTRAHVESLRRPGGRVDCPLLDRWLPRRDPLTLECCDGSTWAPGAAGPPLPPLHGLSVHGHAESSSPLVSMCWFAGTQPARDRPLGVLRMLAPHLHLALARLRRRSLQTAQRQASHGLSMRQLQVLERLRLGKTNAEIALILATSEANVKYHLREIYRKLGVRNRTHAVSAAGGKGAEP